MSRKIYEFRIRVHMYPLITSYDAEIITEYIIQKRVKNLFGNFVWRNFKCWGYDDYQMVYFVELDDAKEYMNNLKEIYNLK